MVKDIDVHLSLKKVVTVCANQRTDSFCSSLNNLDRLCARMCEIIVLKWLNSVKEIVDRLKNLPITKRLDPKHAYHYN